MCRCTGWMEVWTSRSRWSCDARTGGGAPFLGGSRRSRLGYLSMTWMKSEMRSSVNLKQFAVGSQKPGLNLAFSGLGEVAL
jgi:hypothetical protein